MQSIGASSCTCGKQMYDSLERCASCSQTRQKRMSQHAYILPERPAKQLTPPPSQPATPRRSLEGSAAPMAPRLSYANEALINAMGSDNASSSFFPQSIYRSSGRSSLTTSSPYSRIPLESPNLNMPASERKPSRSATPDSFRSAQGGYAPMAAGFARLSKKDDSAQGRPGSARPSLELEARMFSGPA